MRHTTETHPESGIQLEIGFSDWAQECSPQPTHPPASDELVQTPTLVTLATQLAGPAQSDRVLRYADEDPLSQQDLLPRRGGNQLDGAGPYRVSHQAESQPRALRRPPAGQVCSAWTKPSANPCRRGWLTGACRSGRNTWPLSSWPTRPSQFVPPLNMSGLCNRERS